ncbi:MAG: hypothetical protein ABSF28_15900 [Terracidiphilus sp.]|jgi:hypothetical protein
MKNYLFALLLLSSLFAMPAAAKNLDWNTVKKIPPGTQIFVQTSGGTMCSLQQVTDDKLFCTRDYPGSNFHGTHADLVYNRADVHDVCVGDIATCTAFDESKGTPFLIAAIEAGGGWHAGYEPNSFGGVKLGLSGVAMDLQYDRLDGHSGFSVEGSGVVPVFRVPRFRPKNDRLLFRLYAEPGLGYRAGDGPFGQYASAKALVLFGDKWINDRSSPYIEFQHRFPFDSLLSGDNRIAFGLLWGVCAHCGLD